MKKNMINATKIQGFLYEHSLEKKVTGPKSKNPGTEYIAGDVKVVTDDTGLNVVPVHFSYVTPVTSKGKENATFKTLEKIVNGEVGTIMANGKDNAACVRIDSAIGLNEFYTERNGKEEFVSAKRNEGGFIHLIPGIEEPNEKERSTFDCDIVITGCTRIEADVEKDLPEKMTIKGAIFDFGKNLLPVEFTVYNTNAMNYFEDAAPTAKEPLFTRVKGRQVSETIVKKIQEESAFGEPSIREVKSSRKEFVITWAAKEPYVWDSEESITIAEMNSAITARATHVATLKQQNDEYKASKNAGAFTQAPAASNGAVFNF